jgi:hypothetical protein
MTPGCFYFRADATGPPAIRHPEFAMMSLGAITIDRSE